MGQAGTETQTEERCASGDTEKGGEWEQKLTSQERKDPKAGMLCFQLRRSAGQVEPRSLLPSNINQGEGSTAPVLANL